MSEGVRKIITVLIVMVVCVVVGALVINVFAPNAVNAVVGGVEAGIHGATGIEVDLNGDKKIGVQGNTEEQEWDAEAGGTDKFQEDFSGTK